MSSDERAIRDLIATWLQASAGGDNDTVLGLMTDDVVFLVAGRPPFGKAEFAATSNALSTHRIKAGAGARGGGRSPDRRAPSAGGGGCPHPQPGRPPGGGGGGRRGGGRSPREPPPPRRRAPA